MVVVVVVEEEEEERRRKRPGRRSFLFDKRRDLSAGVAMSHLQYWFNKTKQHVD